MPELIDHLYSRFILRDLLAKVIPGFISIISIFTVFNLPHSILLRLLLRLPDFVLFIIIYGFSFMAGMLIQFIMMKFKLIVIHVWPASEGVASHEISLYMANKLIKSSNATEKVLRVRERYTVLKEMSGNYAGGFSVLLLSIISRYLFYKSIRIEVLYIAVPALVVLVTLLIAQNKFHADEQKLWEIYSLVD